MRCSHALAVTPLRRSQAVWVARITRAYVEGPLVEIEAALAGFGWPLTLKLFDPCRPPRVFLPFHRTACHTQGYTEADCRQHARDVRQI